MTASRNAFDAETARMELQACRDFGPALVDAGAIDQQTLDRKLTIWALLAELFEAEGRHPMFDVRTRPLAEVIAAFSRCLDMLTPELARLTAQVESATPEQQPDRTERRDRLRQLHGRIARSRDHWESLQRLNNQLRQAAAQRKAAA